MGLLVSVPWGGGGAEDPVPERVTLIEGVTPLLLMVMLPLLVPVDCGAKFTFTDLLCPAGRVRGRLRPLALKPVPVAVICEIVTLDAPELIRVKP